MPVHDIPDRFDRIGASIARRMMKPAVWTPKGGEPTPVRAGFEGAHMLAVVEGAYLQDVHFRASAQSSVMGSARQGDELAFGTVRWLLASDAQPYGSGDLVRFTLSGPLR